MNTAVLFDLLQPFHKKLFDKAKQYIKVNDNEAAVVFAQAASEMCTEYALTLLLEVRGIDFLTEPLLEIFRVRNITDKRLRKLYTILSGDHIQTMPFWEKLKKHSDRRHKIVHKGERCNKEEAEESISAIDQYIKHIDGVVRQVRSRKTVGGEPD